MAKRERPPQKFDAATEAFRAGLHLVSAHPLFAPLLMRIDVNRQRNNYCPNDGWAVALENGSIHVHPTRRGESAEWAYVLAHALLHFAFDHFHVGEKSIEWNTACDVVVTKFLGDLKFGKRPVDMDADLGDLASMSEERIFARFRRDGIARGLDSLSTAGERSGDLFWTPQPAHDSRRERWAHAFAAGLTASVTSAVRVAGGYESHLGSTKEDLSHAEQARRWFINSYPLLGALAAAFHIVERPDVAQRLGITIAAISAEMKEIYINPASALSISEARFVIAHELLHVGLRHEARRQGRDPHLWNVACDFVINDWLFEMDIGTMPEFGGLHDVSLRGLSAEAIYDQLAVDLRRNRKLATFRGIGEGDMLEESPDWWTRVDAQTLDDFYRRALSQGLTYHQESGRGLLPAGLLEEIRALDRPPIAWDVELARWFDDHFLAIERQRTYARLSRRQSSTPDIARPRYVNPADDATRTYAVVLDTSGSMDRAILAKALGTIASYSIARDVRGVRLVFCDATTYDQGYVSPDEIAGRVKIRGRGGTVLQPGIDLVEKAEDFPEKGPILIITDGLCDRFLVKREHAFLLPQGRSLPFVPKGPVFYIN
ncbi:MAG TPA: VWA-like domain-containing protein [Thermoanaerobaculia bacterium]